LVDGNAMIPLVSIHDAFTKRHKPSSLPAFPTTRLGRSPIFGMTRLLLVVLNKTSNMDLLSSPPCQPTILQGREVLRLPFSDGYHHEMSLIVSSSSPQLRKSFPQPTTDFQRPVNLDQSANLCLGDGFRHFVASSRGARPWP